MNSAEARRRARREADVTLQLVADSVLLSEIATEWAFAPNPSAEQRAKIAKLYAQIKEEWPNLTVLLNKAASLGFD